METHDLFILTGEYLDEGDRHLIRLFGRSPRLGPVMLVFDQIQPLFFVDREEKLPALDFPFDRKPLQLKSLARRPVDGLYFRTQRELRQAADRFRATGVRHFESDVFPVERFLMERFINGTATFAGEGAETDGLTVFHNPRIKAGTKGVGPVVASIDIETGVASGELYSIAAHVTGAAGEDRRVFMLADRREDLPEQLALYPSETALLQAFFSWFAEVDPDILIGWHVVGFDLMFLERKCRALGVDFALARGNGKTVLTDKPGSGYFASISGRVVIDGPPALRGSGTTFASYKLENVAQEILNTGKLITPGQDKVAEIERLFREDKPQLARYNLEDCVLVTKIFERVKLIPLMMERCRISGVLLEHLAIANAAFDHAYLPKLHRKGWVAPVPPEESSKTSAWKLASEVENRPGIYENIAVLQLEHLHAWMVRIFKIDPLGRAMNHIRPVEVPGGGTFSGEEHILPELMSQWVERFGDASDPVRRLATGLTLNAFHSAWTAKNFRFSGEDLARSLSQAVQWYLAKVRDLVESQGYRVIRTDPESVYLQLKPEDRATPEEVCGRIAASVKSKLDKSLSEDYGAHSPEMRFGGFFRKFVLPEQKSEEAALKPCFAGLAEESGRTTVRVVGMEQVAPGGTDLAQFFQTRLFQQFFNGEGFEEWIRAFVDRLKGGDFDGRLVYRKRIRKHVDEYARNAPAHIKAARMLDKPGKEVRYVWTKRGPVPVELNPVDIDHEHYLQKQVQPLADAVLGLMGQSFTDLTEPKQLGLF